MKLKFKPDFADAQAHWRAFWNKEIIKRPCIAIKAPRDGAKRAPRPPVQYLPGIDFGNLLDQAEANMAATYFAGEAIPFFQPSFGPDQLAAFVGGRLDYSKDSSVTTWSAPFVESWEDVLPLELGRDRKSVV